MSNQRGRGSRGRALPIYNPSAKRNPATTASRNEERNRLLSSQSPSQPSVISPVPTSSPSESSPPSQPNVSSGGPPSTTEHIPLDLGRLAGYGIPPGGPLIWDPTILDIEGYNTFFEPQGELQALHQAHETPHSDFDNPYLLRRETAVSGYDNQADQPPAIAQSTLGSIPAQTPPQDMSARSHASSIVTTRAGQKRKADPGRTEGSPPPPHSATSLTAPDEFAKRQSLSASRPSNPRTTTTRSQQGPVSDADRESEGQETELPEPKPSSSRQRESAVERRIVEVSSRLTTVLPAGKVFPIQIGSELFRLSGASISSDAPSYFSHYFGEQLIQTGGRASQVKTLYIDRDPKTFRDIALHLQGYYVKPHNEEHFVRLFADAQFYSLPRLTQQLFKSEIFIQVGNRHFQIPRDTFSSPGDSPNFFSLGFAHFFSTPSEVFPGLDRQTLLRPPSILPPAIANRSGDVFADLLRIMQGYEVNIRDANHRAELLRDAKYFHLKGVEQKLIPCDITFNVLRGRNEVTLRLEDVRQSGVNFLKEASASSDKGKDRVTSKPGSPSSRSITPEVPVGWITYQRPYVDESASDLILEIGSEAARLDMASMRAAFSGQTKARIARLFSVVANKLNLPAMMPLGLMMMQSGGGIAAQPASPANSGVSGDKVRVQIETDAFVKLDGSVVEWAEQRGDSESDDDSDEDESTRGAKAALPKVHKWKEGRTLNEEMEWLVQKGQWRLRVEKAEDAGSPSKVEVVLCAIRIEGYTREAYRNEARGFLT